MVWYECRSVDVRCLLWHGNSVDIRTRESDVETQGCRER